MNAGERHWNGKLNSIIVQYILLSNERPVVLARRFGIGTRHVRKIRSGRAWKRVYAGVKK
jgi:hypothetical protein